MIHLFVVKKIKKRKKIIKFCVIRIRAATVSELHYTVFMPQIMYDNDIIPIYIEIK